MAQLLPNKTVRKGKSNTLPLLPQNAHVNSITFTKKFALVVLTPLHVCFTWVTVNIDLCKYWRPVILIFVYANIYTGSLTVEYHTSGTTSWECSFPTPCHNLGTEKIKWAKEIHDHGLWEQARVSASTCLVSVLLQLEELIWDGDSELLWILNWNKMHETDKHCIVNPPFSCANCQRRIMSEFLTLPRFSLKVIFGKGMSSSKWETTSPFIISALEVVMHLSYNQENRNCRELTRLVYGLLWGYRELFAAPSGNRKKCTKKW